MAAPSGIVWGSTVGSGSAQGRIGIYVKLTSTATETTRHTEIWFWSKYGVSDSSNTFYYNDNATSATSSKGSVNINTTIISGTGWSTSNQIKIASYDYTFTRGTKATTRSVAAKLTGIDYIGSAMTAVATYTIPAIASYTVKYDANGGSGAPSSQKKYNGKSLTLSNTKPTRTGYSFQGWATSASGSVAYDPGDSYTANASITLYAVWKASSYTVAYNANGGTGAPGNQTKTHGKILTLSSTKPTRTGYSFQGWATSASGSVVYLPGDSYTANAAVTLYAVWTIKTYTVKYDANGGSGQPSNQTKTYGKDLTLSSTKPTRAGHLFRGWATSSSGAVTYESGDSYTENATVTLYAVWSINTYKVTYDANGGTLGNVKTQTKTYGVTLKLTGTATRQNYIFKGWATSANGSVVYEAEADYTKNASVTLYAVWELSYAKPTIKNFSVARCNSSGTAAVDGNCARVKFNWTSRVPDPTAIIEWKDTVPASQYIDLSGTSGTVNQIIGDLFSAEKSYSIKVTVDDGKEPQSSTRTLASVVYVVDVKAKGKGVSIGKAAELDDTFDVGFTGKFRKDVEIGEKTTNSDGKTGIHLDSDGFIQIQRDSSQGYHPYIGFFLNAATEPNGQIRLNSETGLMEFLSALGYKFGRDVNIGEKTGYVDGKTGVYINKDGYIHLQRNGQPYIAFLINNETDSRAVMRYNPSYNILEFYKASGGYSFDHDLIVSANSKQWDDGLEGTRISPSGGIVIQRIKDSTPYLYFRLYGTTSGCDAGLSLDATTKYLNFIKAGRYVFDNNIEASNAYLNGSMRIGNSDPTGKTSAFINTYWLDGSYHNIVTRGTDGLTSQFGWAGSADYSTVTSLRGQTCKYGGTSGLTTLSDERLKKDFSDLLKWEAFFISLEPCAFRMKGGASGRYHMGFKAQQVEKALLDNGLTTKDFAGFVKTKYTPDEDDLEGAKVYEEAGIEPGAAEYGLIYTEFTALNTYMIQKLLKENQALKNKVDNLETKLEKLEKLLNEKNV